MKRPEDPSICDSPYALARYSGNEELAIITTPALFIKETIHNRIIKGYLNNIVRNKWNEDAPKYKTKYRI